MGLKDFLTGGRSGDPERATLWTTPWTWRDEEGLYIGDRDQVWLYWVLPVNPIEPHWEDPAARLGLGRRVERLLVDLGSTSKESPVMLRALSSNREIHLLSVTWRTEARARPGTPARQAEYLDDTLGFLVPTKALFIGVRLRGSSDAEDADSLRDQIKGALTSTLAEGVPDLSRYDSDRRQIETMLKRADARPPTVDELRQLESWYNLGRGPDAFIVEDRTNLRIDDVDRIQLAAVYRFNQRINVAPNYQWIADAESHPNGAHVVSVRAELEPGTAARARARQSQRRIKAMIEEELETSDVERPEFTDTYRAAQAVEDHFIGSDQPLMTRCSILMARRANKADETYIDLLRTNHSIDVRPLDHRQLPALDEMLPCSTKRLNPFLQDVSVAMLAYAGMHGFSALGDGDGVYLGLTHPNLTPCYLDPLRSGGENKPPVCAIFGSPGSGKAQPLDAPVLTPSGFRAMGDLAVGDLVVGSDGRPTQVLGVFPQGDRPIVRVRFDDGSSAECDLEHHWVVTDAPATVSGRTWRWVSAEEISRLVDAGSPVHVPVVSPVEHPGVDLGVDWYLLGAVLAGGPEVPGVIAAVAESAGTDAITRCLEVLERDEAGRALLGTIDQRSALLSGALDRVGRFGTGAGLPTGVIRVPDLFSQGLLRPVVHSLGGVVRDDGSGLVVHLPSQVTPSRLRAHLDRYVPGGAPPDRVAVAVDEVGVAPAQCIQVAAGDHVYVTEDYLCTRNTFLAQSIATQSAFRGLPVIFINPKSGGVGSSISGLVDYAGGRRVSLSELANSRGAFDPFRYAKDPEQAADILTAHITSSLRELSEADQLDIAAGIRNAVARGARCGTDALRGVTNERALGLIAKLVRTNPMFALAFGKQDAGAMGVSDGVTLIEFDRPMPLPDPNQDASLHSTAERVALATITLVTRASVQLLANAGGGVLIVDEAWTFLNHPAGRAELDRLGREGRSLNVLAVFCTQRVADLLKHDMASYLSRVFVMRLTDPEEANAAFQIAGLAPTASRRTWLEDAGPRPADPATGRPARWAMALHRDLDGRHAAILVGPTPSQALAAWTTNPEDRRRQAENSAAQGGQ